MSDTVKFQAVVQKVQTLADGGLRFTFDAPEDAGMTAAQLIECHRLGVVLMVKCEVYPQDKVEESMRKY